LLFPVVCAFAGDDPNWQRVQLDARFRSEGVAVADLNNDGLADVIAGDYWYEQRGVQSRESRAKSPAQTGPATPPTLNSQLSTLDFVAHELRPPGDFWAGVGYSQSFCNWAYDLNGDGWQDVIVVGFPGEPFHWYENPKGATGHWKQHVIWHSICNETPQFLDLTGDGRPEVVCGSQPESQMGYLEIPTGDAVYQKWTFTPVSEPGEQGQNGTHRYYHGLGVTDVNGDGRADVIIGHGWWEHPATLGEGVWPFHSRRLAPTPDGNPVTGADIYTEDLDGDGDQDVLMSCAHAHGVWWFENVTAGAKSEFKYHVIDESHSQTHALHFVDLDGDGRRELVTGKRFFAHNGGDPGAYDTVGMYRYEIRRKTGSPPEFERHEILAGRDTGIGTQFSIADVNGDGKLDIALANKKGVNILLQRP
jgi:hypothetical protein